MKSIIYYIIYLLFLTPIYAFSQTYSISGKVIDKQNNAVDYAEIVLSTSDTLPLQSQLCQEDGTFILKDIAASTYLIQIRTLGKEHFSQIINVNKNIHIGDIIVDPSIKIQEITVIATKKIIEHQIDRLVFNVGNSIAAIGSDGLDVLSITPSVRILNDQISLIGRNSLKVMVNDKIIALSGEDLTNFLKNIKSEQIDKIEVIMNPPSKYEAEGNNGLINIKLKNAPQNSFNGVLRGTLSQADKSIGVTGINLNFQKNKLSITSNLSYTNGIFQPDQSFNIFYPNKFWNEINKRNYYYNDFSSLFTIDYKISSQIKIGTFYNFSVASPTSKYNNKVFIYNKSNILDSLIINNSRNEINKKTYDLTVYSEFVLDTIGSKLNVDINYLNYNSFNNNVFLGKTFDKNQNSIDNSIYHANNCGDLNIKIYNVKLDFTYPFKWVRINFGTKLSFMKNTSSVDYYNIILGTPIIDISRTDKFNYRENIQSFYISGAKKLNAKLQLQIGLRGELLQSKGYSYSLKESNKDSYIKLFPTIYVNYNLSEKQILLFNYNKRINRPPYNLLNPFRFYSTSFNHSEGNPFLKPYFTDNLSFSYVYQNYYASLYFNKINNKFDKITYIDNTSMVQIVKPRNFYNVIGAGLYQEITFNLNKRWENTSDLSIYYNKATSKEPIVIPNIDSWSSSISTNNTFIIGKNRNIRFFINFLYQSPSLAGSYKLSEYYQLDCGFRANLFNNKLSLSISGSDILKTNKLTFYQQVNGIQQKNYDYGDTRRLKIAIVYSFGKTFQLDKRKRINDDEIKRL